MEDRINYALKNFLNDNFRYDSDSSTYELLELADEGKSRLTVHVGTTENICVKNYDKFPKWGIINNSKKLHLSKCVDHFIFKQNQLGTWELHIFEMKTSVGFKTWNEIKYKLRPSYLSIKTIAIYLGIPIKDENIIIHTTYEHDCMEIKNMDTPRIAMPSIGGKAIDVKKNEWDAGLINVPIVVSKNNPYDFHTTVKLRHKKILMHRAKDGFLENTISL